jgi:hypothetical protein
VASANLSEMAIGFLDIEKWRLPAEAQNSDPAYYAETVCPLSRSASAKSPLLIDYPRPKSTGLPSKACRAMVQRSST